KVDDTSLDGYVVPRQPDGQILPVAPRSLIESLCPAHSKPRGRRGDLCCGRRLLKRIRAKILFRHRETEPARGVGGCSDRRQRLPWINEVGQVQLRSRDGPAVRVEDATGVLEALANLAPFPWACACGDTVTLRLRWHDLSARGLGTDRQQRQAQNGDESQ